MDDVQTNIMIVGATESNAGKTTFISRIIENNTKKDIIALKVTTINNDDFKHLKKGENYSLIKEVKGDSNKDTNRMYEAGAESVYWLCVRKNYHQQAFSIFQKEIGNGKPVICESTSLRKVVTPKIFIVLRLKNVDNMKPSCKEVYDRADYVVEFDQNEFNMAPEQFVYKENSWQIIK